MSHDKHYDHAYAMSRGGGRSALPFIAGIAATMIVGGYMLFGPQGRRNRRGVDRFIKRAKYEILDKMDQAGDVTEEQYHKIVDEVSARYDSLKETGEDTASSVSSYFSERWGEMKEAASRARDEVRDELEEEERSIRSGTSAKRSETVGGDNTPSSPS